MTITKRYRSCNTLNACTRKLSTCFLLCPLLTPHIVHSLSTSNTRIVPLRTPFSAIAATIISAPKHSRTLICASSTNSDAHH